MPDDCQRNGLKAVIGSIVLCAVILVWQQPSIGRTRLTEIVGGTASGFGALVSSIGGPMLALLYRNEKGSTLRALYGSNFCHWSLFFIWFPHFEWLYRMARCDDWLLLHGPHTDRLKNL